MPRPCFVILGVTTISGLATQECGGHQIVAAQKTDCQNAKPIELENISRRISVDHVESALKVAKEVRKLDKIAFRKLCFRILLYGSSLTLWLSLFAFLLFPMIKNFLNSLAYFQPFTSDLETSVKAIKDVSVNLVLFLMLAFPPVIMFFGQEDISLWLRSKLSNSKIISIAVSSDWEFQGLFVKKEKDDRESFYLANSDLGCVIRNKVWRNYEMKLDFWVSSKNKYQKGWYKNDYLSGFGVIVRAQDLKNYYMIKIDGEGIKPHMRRHGYWETHKPIDDWELKQDDCNSWIPLEVIVKNDNVVIKINGRRVGAYILPIDAAVPPVSEEEPFLLTSSIPFRKYGSVGFRAAGNEEVYISNLDVSPL